MTISIGGCNCNMVQSAHLAPLLHSMTIKHTLDTLRTNGPASLIQVFTSANGLAEKNNRIAIVMPRSALSPSTRISASASASATSGALAALSRDVARRILIQGHHLSHQSNLQRLGTALGASGPNLLHPHYTPSPLSSATLLASYLKHRILRNLENVSMPIIRRTLDMVSEKHPIWQHQSPQQSRRVQSEQALAHLEARERTLLLRLEFDEHSARLKEELETVRTQQGKLKLLLDCMEDTVRGSLHPVSVQQDDRVFLTPSEAAQLPSPSATLRGLLIRFRGPRRGNRAFKWEKSTGRISTNSVGFVVSEEAKIPIPSKLGVYGLTVRIVYVRRNRLVDCRTPLNVVDWPGFVFLKNPSSAAHH